MAIIPSLPITLQNGTTADATQVMANFNAIVSAVNSNAAGSGINTNITQLTGLTVAIAVNQGGTGQQILTPNGVIVGAGVAGVTAVAPAAAGTVLTSNGAGINPSYQPPVPSGAGMWWPTNTAPTGWIEANGQSTAPYVNLIPIYGANVPDMRGQFVRAWDHGAGIDPGRNLLTTEADAIASHTSTSVVTDPTHQHHSSVGYSQKGGSGNGDAYSDSQGGSSPVGSGDPGGGTLFSATGISVATTYTGATETRPKNIAWMFIIKT